MCIECEMKPLFDEDGYHSVKKYSLKLFLFLFILLIQTKILYADPVSPKLPDTPIDKSVRVKVHTGYEYCYAPAFVDGESYIYIDNCSSPNVLAARYDVFQRVAWKRDGVWLCMTAPNSVTGIDGKATENWDYILLRPCVINDANQRWIIKNSAFYTADGKFRVKDYKWYAYISKTEGDYYNHTLSSAMDAWSKTIAAPGTISLKTSLGWKFASRFKFDMYYIADMEPQSDVIDLYYNPENGHIARYTAAAGFLHCMVSQQSSSDNWNWVKWDYCEDTVANKKDNYYWDISALNGRDGPILDHQGNFLRVTRYGANWGAPYTAKPNFLKEDNNLSPTSEFVLSYDIQRWNRYVYRNLENSLAYCPAPGNKKTIVTQPKRRAKRTLPPAFVLDEEWFRRLHNIAISVDDPLAFTGICGVCLLHTYQMIAELQQYHSVGPLTRGGYFFNTAPNTNPMLSFRARYPALYDFIQNVPRVQGFRLHPRETDNEVQFRVVSSMTQFILSRYNWRASNIAMGLRGAAESVRQLLTAPPGSMWIAFVMYGHPDGTRTGHAMPMIRGQNGIMVIPTNVGRISYSDFVTRASENTILGAIMNQIARRNTIIFFATLQLIGEEQNPLNVAMSQSNCTGDGDDRRGNRQWPRSATVNQCASGRCSF
ncbi:DUF1561 family protein [Bartonella sp. A05]|uniref:DUF1561 family protein n=1 Tax=Bartonella sp. A05 TaxID=2967261 RepID=UPI0022A93787|nr:DUF1561 family protein [Bartonella sp. A05]MCZ2203323.1 DUF1561 domain-containing protein [Bartonella sp. A05]